MHIGIDASSWHNERGFGRFTRCLVAALAARDSGMRYTLLFDQEPTIDTPDGVAIEVAGSQSIANASGAYGRSGNYMLRMGAAARRLNSDVFFFPTVYSYFPLFSRVPKVICYHDTIPERFPDLIFPNRINAALWKAKTLLAKWQATRVMTVSQASAKDIVHFFSINPTKIDLVTEGPDPSFFAMTDESAVALARTECRVPEGARLLIYVGGFNRHKNVIRLIEAMPQVLLRLPGYGWPPFIGAVFTAAFFMLLTVKAVTLAFICGALAVASILIWMWASDPPPVRLQVGDGTVCIVGVSIARALSRRNPINRQLAPSGSSLRRRILKSPCWLEVPSRVR